MKDRLLTGNTGHRSSVFGKVILMVEYWARIPPTIKSILKVRYTREWRDADMLDLVALARGEITSEDPSREISLSGN